jgi:hypothetical protein
LFDEALYKCFRAPWVTPLYGIPCPVRHPLYRSLERALLLSVAAASIVIPAHRSPLRQKVEERGEELELEFCSRLDGAVIGTCDL